MHNISKRTLIILVALCGLLFMGLAAGAVSASGNPHDQVAICHATGNGGYTSNTVNADGSVNGHDGHSGDIIPPFDYVDPQNNPQHYPGKNWDTAGQAIYNNDCTAPTPPVTDVCPNLQGDQASVPDGYRLDDSGNCVPVEQPVDVCPNLDGLQTEVPTGYHLDDGNCVQDEETVDLCPNLEGTQVDVPEGMHIDNDGNCVPDEETPCPTGYVLVGDVCVPRHAPQSDLPAWQPQAGSITAWSIIGTPSDAYWWEYNSDPDTQGWNVVYLDPAHTQIAWTYMEFRDRQNDATGEIQYDTPMTRLTIRVNGDDNPAHYRAHFAQGGVYGVNDPLTGEWYDNGSGGPNCQNQVDPLDQCTISVQPDYAH